MIGIIGQRSDMVEKKPVQGNPAPAVVAPLYVDYLSAAVTTSRTTITRTGNDDGCSENHWFGV